jgi:diguanylate cyclase (GGDEF)-like protein
MKLFGFSEAQTSKLIDAVAEKSVELISQFNIDPRQLKPFSQILQEANEGLSRVNLSYEMLVVDLKEAKEKAERLAIEMKGVNERLREAAIRDGLTGLYNHRYFQEAIVNEITRATRHERPVGLVMIDIDHFKAVNDKYGHQIGDYLLRMIAGQIAKGSRASDTVARHGGEEFAIILPETDLKGAGIKGESCRRAIESMDFYAGSEVVHTTISVGVAVFDPRRPISKDELIESADRALYRSKNEGRNRVTLWAVYSFKERLKTPPQT